jgi:hypothetical protein
VPALSVSVVEVASLSVVLSLLAVSLGPGVSVVVEVEVEVPSVPVVVVVVEVELDDELDDELDEELDVELDVEVELDDEVELDEDEDEDVVLDWSDSSAGAPVPLARATGDGIETSPATVAPPPASIESAVRRSQRAALILGPHSHRARETSSGEQRAPAWFEGVLRRTAA